MKKLSQSVVTTLGIKDSKIEKLEAKVVELTPEPKSAGGESFKESVRMLLSILIGMAVTYTYFKYPLLGTLQPDQATLITAIVSVTVRGIDKFVYQWLKNRGKVVQGIGLDLPLQTIANVMTASKGKVDQIK